MIKDKGVKVFLAILGIFLIIIQIANYCGVSRMYTGLFPDNEHMLYPQYVSKSEFNPKMIFLAIESGLDRFGSGFEDLTYPKDKWRVSTSTQYASANIRESLGCSTGGGFGLFIYDTFVLISYCSLGIIGFVLLMISIKKRT